METPTLAVTGLKLRIMNAAVAYGNARAQEASASLVMETRIEVRHAANDAWQELHDAIDQVGAVRDAS
jgi:hypothetical protein